MNKEKLLKDLEKSVKSTIELKQSLLKKTNELHKISTTITESRGFLDKIVNLKDLDKHMSKIHKTSNELSERMIRNNVLWTTNFNVVNDAIATTLGSKTLVSCLREDSPKRSKEKEMYTKKIDNLNSSILLNIVLLDQEYERYEQLKYLVKKYK